METRTPLPDPTLALDDFWHWLVLHPNCILRAGTQDALVYDDEDLHWHFSSEGPETFLVQVLRGKRILGEILIAREHVAYVQAMAGDQEGEFVFELIAENEAERVAAYFFVLSHGYDAEEPSTLRRVH